MSRRPVEQTGPLPHRDPAHPPDYDLATFTAIRSVAQGNGTPEQQRRAIEWIVHTAADTYGLSYRANDTTGTAFAEGRRFVGLAVVKLLNLNPDVVRGRGRPEGEQG